MLWRQSRPRRLASGRSFPLTADACRTSGSARGDEHDCPRRTGRWYSATRYRRTGNMSKRLVGGVAVRMYPRTFATAEARRSSAPCLMLVCVAGSVRATARLADGWRSCGAIATGACRAARKARCTHDLLGRIVAVIQLPFKVRSLGPGGDSPGVPRVTVRDMYVSPLVILASFTLGGRRLAGLLGLVWVALYVRDWEPPAWL